MSRSRSVIGVAAAGVIRAALTSHATARLRQRGMRERDVDFVLEHGTVTEEAVVLTNKDVDEAIAAHRREIARLERLRGTAVFTRDEAVVTVFRPTPDQMRRMKRPDGRMHRVRRRSRRAHA